MKIQFHLFFLVLFFLGFKGQSQGRIVGDITNFRNSDGLCVACLFNNASAFTGNAGKPVACKKIPIEKKATQVVFEDVLPGEYALMVFHDANRNGKMDTNFLGIPNEGYGASKNRLPFASAPVFKDNKFLVKKNATVHLRIRLRNL